MTTQTPWEKYRNGQRTFLENCGLPKDHIDQYMADPKLFNFFSKVVMESGYEKER